MLIKWVLRIGLQTGHWQLDVATHCNTLEHSSMLLNAAHLKSLHPAAASVPWAKNARAKLTMAHLSVERENNGFRFSCTAVEQAF